MAYYYGTTYQNVINCSSMDWKTLRDFLGLVGSAARTTEQWSAITEQCEHERPIRLDQKELGGFSNPLMSSLLHSDW
ncbi:hypothetical protein TNCV_4958711 [Trichonephila clavipes]|uniref:Uncharacterized protein n=1 Tax=Trichonephila clavipes TaxID=2585209 RepID=A0A8X6SJS7_TRICX|nr:hypothetical protein TNCV_4958711 [Trichonephila clavipes]